MLGYFDSVSAVVGLLLIMSLTILSAPADADDPPEAPPPEPTEAPREVPELLSTTIAGGGGEILTSSSFRMTGTVGPPDAGSASSPSYQISGGFSGSGSVGNPEPVFADGFESGGTGAWSGTVP